MGIVGVGISTRYLGVDAYGALVAGLAFSSVVGIITDIGLWQIGVREIAKRPDEADRILGSLLTVGLALSGGAVLIGAPAAFLVYGGGDDELIRRAILLLLITAPLAAPYGAINAFFMARQQAYVGMAVSVSGSAILLGTLVAATAFDWGFTGVVLAYVVGNAAQGLLMVAIAVGRVRLRPSTDLRLATSLLRWAVPLGGAMVVHSLYWRIDLILLSVLSSKAEVALYGLSYRFVDALAMVPSFVTVTLLPEFARLTENRQRFDEIMQKAFTVMQVGAVAMLVLFVGFAEEVTRILGGEGFADAAPVLRILVAGVALTYLGAILAQALVAVNRQKSLFWMTLVLLPGNVALNLVLIPLWGASGAALAFAVTELVHLVILLVLYRGVGAIPRPRRAPQVLAAAALMGGVALLKLVPFVQDAGAVAVLSVGAAASLGLYVAALYAFRAMPREVHVNLVLPLWARLRPKRAAS
jgi:O-antigen/teichoic acid export membrane protein